MTNDPIYHRLLELSWRRKLTEAEQAELQAWLAAHPEAQAEWQNEASLNAMLETLADVPVPSNFTSRVLTAAQKDVPASGRMHFWSWRFKWLPRAAFAAVVLGSGLLVYHQHLHVVQKEFAQDLVRIGGVSSMPSEILTNFEAIRLMSAANTTQAADVQLLTLLQ